MGDIYTGLVPAAVLFNSNGLTREEYSKRLLKLRGYHLLSDAGLHGVAQALGLPFTEQYEKFIQSEEKVYDNNGLRIYPTRFYIEISKDKKPKVSYSVAKHLENILGEEKILDNEIVFSEVQAGKLHHPWWGGPSSLIVEVLDFIEDYAGFDKHKMYTAKLVVKEIKQKFEEHNYKTLNALVKSGSIFAPDNMYNFSQIQGIVKAGGYENNFYWIKKDDKYHLDKEQTFDNIKVQRWGYKSEEGFTKMNLGYTDFILTAEALKHHNLSIIFRGPKNEKKPFIKKYPDARRKYYHAVWQGHVSMFGKEKDMTNSELIRYMVLGRFMIGDYKEISTYDASCDLI